MSEATPCGPGASASVWPDAAMGEGGDNDKTALKNLPQSPKHQESCATMAVASGTDPAQTLRPRQAREQTGGAGRARCDQCTAGGQGDTESRATEENAARRPVIQQGILGCWSHGPDQGARMRGQRGDSGVGGAWRVLGCGIWPHLCSGPRSGCGVGLGDTGGKGSRAPRAPHGEQRRPQRRTQRAPLCLGRNSAEKSPLPR